MTQACTACGVYDNTQSATWFCVLFVAVSIYICTPPLKTDMFSQKFYFFLVTAIHNVTQAHYIKQIYPPEYLRRLEWLIRALLDEFPSAEQSDNQI